MILHPISFWAGVSYTARTQAFLTATGINDTTIANALNDFDLGLISNSLDSKFLAIYPMVGGSATTHKYNFMNAVDSDAAFRLTFNGGWTHSSTGALPASNGYARTYLTPSVSLAQNSSHLSYYSRTDLNNTGTDIGSYSGQGLLFRSRFSSSSGGISFYCNDNSGAATSTNLSSKAWYYCGRDDSATIDVLRNSTIYALSIASTGISTREIYIGCLNVNGTASQFGQRECSMATIGNGLTQTDAQTLYSLIQTFQTSLSRNV